jgi:hypothetical protein
MPKSDVSPLSVGLLALDRAGFTGGIMAEPNENLEDEAQAYVEALPDETAAGRLVKDDGTPADEEEWRLERSTQDELSEDAE